MKVVYSGCKWNTVVFAIDQHQEEFEEWISRVWHGFQHVVKEDPIKFKVTNRRGPMFPNFPIQPSRDPELYPAELRCRLMTKRISEEEHECISQIECQGERVDPSQVWSGAYMTPILQLGYYKKGDDFGLTFTVLKAEYEPSVVVRPNWQMDVENANATGSSSSSEGGAEM